MEYISNILKGVSMGVVISAATVLYSEIKIESGIEENNNASIVFLNQKFIEKEKLDSLRAIAFYDSLALDRGLKIDYKRIEDAHAGPVRELRQEMNGLVHLMESSLRETIYQDSVIIRDANGWYYFFKWAYDIEKQKMILKEY